MRSVEVAWGEGMWWLVWGGVVQGIQRYAGVYALSMVPRPILLIFPIALPYLKGFLMTQRWTPKLVKWSTKTP